MLSLSVFNSSTYKSHQYLGKYVALFLIKNIVFVFHQEKCWRDDSSDMQKFLGGRIFTKKNEGGNCFRNDELLHF